MEKIEVVAGLGSGLMGSQIALNSAKYGFKTILWIRSEASVGKVNAWLDGYIAGRIAKGRISQEESEKWRANLTVTRDMETAVKDADLIIESVWEEYEAKKNIIAECNKYMKPSCIFGSNSSAMPSSRFAEFMKDPSKLCNMHFFNPALVMELVEVVKGPHTSQETADTVMEVSRKMGKAPICLNKESDGFVVSAMLGAVQRKAYELVEAGICNPRELDIAMEKGCNYPMGPFRLMDLTGIDLSVGNWYARWKASPDTVNKPPQFLVDQYLTGNYGKKTGKGWYDYT